MCCAARGDIDFILLWIPLCVHCTFRCSLFSSLHLLVEHVVFDSCRSNDRDISTQNTYPHLPLRWAYRNGHQKRTKKSKAEDTQLNRNWWTFYVNVPGVHALLWFACRSRTVEVYISSSSVRLKTNLRKDEHPKKAVIITQLILQLKQSANAMYANQKF